MGKNHPVTNSHSINPNINHQNTKLLDIKHQNTSHQNINNLNMSHPNNNTNLTSLHSTTIIMTTQTTLDKSNIFMLQFTNLSQSQISNQSNPLQCQFLKISSLHTNLKRIITSPQHLINLTALPTMIIRGNRAQLHTAQVFSIKITKVHQLTNPVTIRVATETTMLTLLLPRSLPNSKLKTETTSIRSDSQWEELFVEVSFLLTLM